MSDNKPYKALIHINTYVYEVGPTGETGKHISMMQREKMGIKNKIIQILGESLEDCADKIKAKIDEISKLQ